MLAGGYLKLAVASLRSTRWRTALTVLGIVIGVVSVVTIISLGEGVKQQVSQEINQRGDDLITILPGKRVARDKVGNIVNFNLFGQNNILFSEADYRIVQQVKGIGPVVPFGQVVGLVQTREREYPAAQVIATTEALPEVLNQKIEFGSFFKDNEVSTNSAVIGPEVAERLFGENVPMGKSFMIRGHEFVVRGIFEEFPISSPLVPGGNYNNAIFIPYNIGQELMGGSLQVYQVLAKPADVEKVEPTIDAISAALTKNRAGQEDFTILKQEENLALASSILNLLTNLIAGIAAISLLVGGIGIMNIMLVSVTERTQEIGIRKAVGATNRQILYQFMAEAAVLSFAGGLFGVILSVIVNFVIRIFTDLQPVVTLPAIGIACAVAFGVGVVFGVAPAIRAARKDPIDALRYE